MGTVMMDKAWTISDLHHTEKYVLLALAYYGEDDTGNAWISASEIANLTNVSQRQVFRILKALKQRGFITNATGVFGKSLWHLTALTQELEPVNG
jgi:DNA-binding MarR family transcriptional regulator